MTVQTLADLVDRGSRNPDAMTISVMDYSGHPCQMQLSRTLAERGHRVRHLHCPDYASGKGDLHVRATDPVTLSIEPVSLDRAFNRYNLVQRLGYEIRYGFAAARALSREKSDAIVLSNVPLIAHAIIVLLLARRTPLVFWQQDVYSHAINVNLSHRWGFVGRWIGPLADRIEGAIARRSRHTVAITEAFRPTLTRWGIADDQIDVVPNWAAIDEMPELPRHNAWSRAHGLDDRLVAMYSGTLGLKHDPSRLLELAKVLRAQDASSAVVVVSEGTGRAWLEHERDKHGLTDELILLDYQHYSDLPKMLASADFFITLLEPDAGVFSVPSKTLNYLCAARPTLGVMPKVNLAASILIENDAGIVLDDPSRAELEEAVRDLVRNPRSRSAMARNARDYAERTFRIDRVADTFETILSSVTTGRRRSVVRLGARQRSAA